MRVTTHAQSAEVANKTRILTPYPPRGDRPPDLSHNPEVGGSNPPPLPYELPVSSSTEPGVPHRAESSPRLRFARRGARVPNQESGRGSARLKPRLPQRLEESSAAFHGPRAPRLGGPVVFASRMAAAHVESAAVPIDVRPLQRRRFADSQSGIETEQPNEVIRAAFRFGRCHELRHV